MAEKERKNRIYRAAAKLYLRTLSRATAELRETNGGNLTGRRRRRSRKTRRKFRPPNADKERRLAHYQRERHVCDLLLLLFAMLSS